MHSFESQVQTNPLTETALSSQDVRHGDVLHPYFSSIYVNTGDP